MIVKSKNLSSKAALLALAIILGLDLNSAQAMEQDEHTAHVMVAKSVDMKDLRSYAETSKGLHEIALQECKERMFSANFPRYTCIIGGRPGHNWVGTYLQSVLTPGWATLASELMTAEQIESYFKRAALQHNQR